MPAKVLVLYDPPYADSFQPFREFFPFWEIRVGALTPRERWSRIVPDYRVYLCPASELAEVASALAPHNPVKEPEQITEDAIFVASTLIPGPGFNPVAVADKGNNPFCKRMTGAAFKELLQSSALSLQPSGEGRDFLIVRKPWETVTHLSTAIKWDARFFDGMRVWGNITVVGPSDELHCSPTASVMPFVVADTTHGPVIIDDGAEVKSHSLLEGPLYIGKKTFVLGGKVSGSSFGESCRVMGEVTDSIFNNCVNKAHYGFIGHSCVADFVNFGAMTTNSNLKNTYGEIRLVTPDWTGETKLTKFGMLCGPHTKFGIGSLIPTGSVIGGFCNLFAGGSFLPKHMGHFVWYDGLDSQIYRFDQAIRTAEKMAERRGRHFSAAETRRALAIYRKVFKPPR